MKRRSVRFALKEMERIARAAEEERRQDALAQQMELLLLAHKPVGVGAVVADLRTGHRLGRVVGRQRGPSGRLLLKIQVGARQYDIKWHYEEELVRVE